MEMFEDFPSIDEVTLMFHDQVLVPSGGWLGAFTNLCAEQLGMWDISTFLVLFLNIWIICRSTSIEITMILGFWFDFVIPLQYANSKRMNVVHEKHLAAYWPKFIVTLLLESACYFFLTDDEMAWFVCFKTMLTTYLWFSKQADGSPVVLELDPDARARMLQDEENRAAWAISRAHNKLAAQQSQGPAPSRQDFAGQAELINGMGAVLDVVPFTEDQKAEIRRSLGQITDLPGCRDWIKHQEPMLLKACNSLPLSAAEKLGFLRSLNAAMSSGGTPEKAGTWMVEQAASLREMLKRQGKGMGDTANSGGRKGPATSPTESPTDETSPGPQDLSYLESTWEELLPKSSEKPLAHLAETICSKLEDTSCPSSAQKWDVAGEVLYDFMCVDDTKAAKEFLTHWQECEKGSQKYDDPARNAARNAFCKNNFWTNDLDEVDKKAKACGVKPYTRRAMVRALMSLEDKRDAAGVWMRVNHLLRMEDQEDPGARQVRKKVNKEDISKWKNQVIFGNRFGVSERMVRELRRINVWADNKEAQDDISRFRNAGNLEEAISFAKGLTPADPEKVNTMAEEWSKRHKTEENMRKRRLARYDD